MRSFLVLVLLFLTAACSSARDHAAPAAGQGGAEGVGVDAVTTVGSSAGGIGGAFLPGPTTPTTCEEAAKAQTSVGCAFAALKPDVVDYFDHGCLAVFVANVSKEPVHLTVSRAGQPLAAGGSIATPVGQGVALSYVAVDPADGLAPGEVAIVFIAHRDGGVMPSCPVTPLLTEDVGVQGTGIGVAFRIETDAPVVAYQIMPYGGGAAVGSSATMLMPETAWGTRYLAASASPKGAFTSEQPSIAIVAREDATEVTIDPKVDVDGGGGVAGTPAQGPLTVTLDRGHYLQLAQDEELSGSVIASDKPVAVFGAQGCLTIPVTQSASCDCAHEQLPPVSALGHDYAAVAHRARSGAPDEPHPWMIVGAVDGTQLTWSPAKPAAAPATIDRGDVVRFSAEGPFTVASQDEDHPFYLAGYMASGADAAGEGDPEWVNVVPTAQYLRRYVFFTDPTFSETSLTVVRRPKPGEGFAEVTLDCLGAIDGWMPLDGLEYAHVDLVTGAFEAVNGCENGRHVIESDGPFGLVVWGWGLPVNETGWVSYAYPGGAGTAVINDVMIPAPK